MCHSTAFENLSCDELKCVRVHATQWITVFIQFPKNIDNPEMDYFFKTKCPKLSIHPISKLLILFSVEGGLQPIPACLGNEVMHVLNWSPVYHRANSKRQTNRFRPTSNFKLSVHLTSMSLSLWQYDTLA